MTKIVSDAQVLTMRLSDERSDVLAERFGLSRSHVASILHGRLRKSAGGPLRERLVNRPRSEWSIAELAYMAGMVDGEGSISIHPTRGRVKGTMYDRFETSLHVYNSNVSVLDWIKARFGGFIYSVKRYNPREKPGFSWKVGHATASLVLTNILPYLIIKRRQAEILIEYQSTRKRCGSNGVPIDVLTHREVLVSELRILNKRGSDAVEFKGRFSTYKEG
jgi:hypothetical protein